MDDEPHNFRQFSSEQSIVGSNNLKIAFGLAYFSMRSKSWYSFLNTLGRNALRIMFNHHAIYVELVSTQPFNDFDSGASKFFSKWFIISTGTHVLQLRMPVRMPLHLAKLERKGKTMSSFEGA